MPLSKPRRQFLIAYRYWHDRGGLTLGSLMGLRFVGFLAIAVVGFTAGFLAGRPSLMGFAVGFLAEAVEIDYLTSRRVMRSWPMIADVVDWQRVDRLLDEDERPAAGG